MWRSYSGCHMKLLCSVKQKFCNQYESTKTPCRHSQTTDRIPAFFKTFILERNSGQCHVREKSQYSGGHACMFLLAPIEVFFQLEFAAILLSQGSSCVRTSWKWETMRGQFYLDIITGVYTIATQQDPHPSVPHMLSGCTLVPTDVVHRSDRLCRCSCGDSPIDSTRPVEAEMQRQSENVGTMTPASFS